MTKKPVKYFSVTVDKGDSQFDEWYKTPPVDPEDEKLAKFAKDIEELHQGRQRHFEFVAQVPPSLMRWMNEKNPATFPVDFGFKIEEWKSFVDENHQEMTLNELIEKFTEDQAQKHHPILAGDFLTAILNVSADHPDWELENFQRWSDYRAQIIFSRS